jgi:hypothetical protein
MYTLIHTHTHLHTPFANLPRPSPVKDIGPRKGTSTKTLPYLHKFGTVTIFALLPIIVKELYELRIVNEGTMVYVCRYMFMLGTVAREFCHRDLPVRDG